MSYEEKGVWVYLLVSVAVYVAYLGVILSQPEWIWPLVISVGISIAASIVLRIVVEIVTPSESYRADARDRGIARRGDAAGNWLVIAGAVAGLILALVSAESFWIANAIYLGFVLSAVVASVVKIAAYRGALQPW